MTRDEISDVYRRIACVTTRYTFTAPVAPDDLETVCHALEAAVPGFRVSVQLVAGGVQVDVYEPAGPRMYARLMLVECGAGDTPPVSGTPH